jgi:hypothetical protein
MFSKERGIPRYLNGLPHRSAIRNDKLSSQLRHRGKIRTTDAA